MAPRAAGDAGAKTPPAAATPIVATARNAAAPPAHGAPQHQGDRFGSRCLDDRRLRRRADVDQRERIEGRGGAQAVSDTPTRGAPMSRGIGAAPPLTSQAANAS